MTVDLNISAEMRAAIEGARDDSVDEWPVALLLAGLPLALFAPAMAAIADGLERAGFDAFIREQTGAGVIWVRPRE